MKVTNYPRTVKVRLSCGENAAIHEIAKRYGGITNFVRAKIREEVSRGEGSDNA